MSDTEQTSFSLEELSAESGFDTRVIRSFIENGLIRGPSTLGRYAKYSRPHLERLRAIKILKEKQGLRLSEVRQQLLTMSDAEITALAETGSSTFFSDSTKKPQDSALDYILSQGQQFMTSDVQPAAATSSAMFDEDDDWDDESDDNVNHASTMEVDSVAEPARTIAEAIRAKLGFKSKPVSLTPEPGLEKPVLSETVADDDDPDEPAPQAVAQLSGWGPASEDEQRITHERLSTPVDRLAEALKQQAGSKTVRRQAKREIWYRIQVTPDIELSVRGINDEQLTRLERVADYLRELLTGGSYE